MQKKYEPCPFLITEVQEELKKHYGTEMTISDLVFRTLGALAKIHSVTSDHMIRTAGAYVAFTGDIGNFFHVADHDTFKIERIFYDNIAKNYSRLEKTALVKQQIFRHVAVAPIGLRNLESNFQIPFSREWMVILALHHYLGSGMPSIEPPTIDDFVFHKKYEQEDKEYIRLVMESLDLIAARKRPILPIANTITYVTAIDIIDAQFRRPYVAKTDWDTMLAQIVRSLDWSLLPDPTKQQAISWISSFRDEEDYYDTVMKAWHGLVPPAGFIDDYYAGAEVGSQSKLWIASFSNVLV